MAVTVRYPSNLATTETISFDAFLAARRAGTPVFAEGWTPDVDFDLTPDQLAETMLLVADPVVAALPALVYVGTGAAPITDVGTARPVEAGPVYWLCANAVAPTAVAPGDIVWNAPAV